METHLKLVALPKITDPRGNLSFIQKGEQCPFAPRRVFWTYNVPSGSVRGGHAYRKQSELIVAINGSFEVCVKHIDGTEQHFFMNRGNQGLLLPPLTWRSMVNFSTNAIGLHLSNSRFDEADYIRDFNELKTLAS